LEAVVLRRVVFRVGEIPQVVRFRVKEVRGVRESPGLFGEGRSLVWAQEELEWERRVDLGWKRQPDSTTPEVEEMRIGEFKAS
jgi:hypothetical protein